MRSREQFYKLNFLTGALTYRLNITGPLSLEPDWCYFSQVDPNYDAVYVSLNPELDLETGSWVFQTSKHSNGRIMGSIKIPIPSDLLQQVILDRMITHLNA